MIKIPYDRTFWREFIEKTGGVFDISSEERPRIFFDGYQEDCIDPDVYDDLVITLGTYADFISVTVTRSNEENPLLKDKIDFLLPFDKIEEVQLKHKSLGV